jgi:Membrane bound FAD containing D-sorbitol dehydrogenase
MNSSVTPIMRRDFLAGLAAAIAAAGSAGFPASLFAASSIRVEQFATLSKTLTQSASLDPDVARTLLGAFIATGHEADLAALIADSSSAAAKNAPLANAIVAAWYSGVCNTATGQAVATFEGALMWNAMTYTKPFGICGGDTGYWSDPPKA